MQQLLSLEVKTLPNDKVIGKDTPVSSDNKESGIDFKGLLGELLGNIKTKESDESEKSFFTDDDKKKLDLKLSDSTDTPMLDDVLNLVTFLKTSGLKGNFPTDSKELTKVLNNEQALNDFKNVKSFQDIVDVAKKYDIDIKKFEISKIDVDTVDEKLNKNTFDEDLSNQKFTKTKDDFLKQKSVSSEKILSNILQKKDNSQSEKTTVKESKTSILQSIITSSDKNKEVKTKDINLSKILSQVSDKSEEKISQTKTKDIKNNIKDIKVNTVSQDLDQKQVPKISDEKLHMVANSDKEIHQIKEGKNVEGKVVLPGTKSNIETNKEIKTVKKQKSHKKSDIQDSEIELDELVSIKKDNTKNEPKITQKSEVKEVGSYEKSQNFDKVISNLGSNSKNKVKTEHNKSEDKTKKMVSDIKEKDTLKPVFSSKDNAQTQLNLHTTKHNTSINQIKNDTNTTQSLNTFANDLKEQIENYKPPLMKVKMTLSPKDLGDVNVNLITRGNSLQVTINSNTNTMALFTQNQAEFKNALVNMGFTNLNMNFSSNGNQNKNQGGSSKQNYKSLNELNEEEIAQIDTVELTIPRYI